MQYLDEVLLRQVSLWTLQVPSSIIIPSVLCAISSGAGTAGLFVEASHLNSVLKKESTAETVFSYSWFGNTLRFCHDIFSGYQQRQFGVQVQRFRNSSLSVPVNMSSLLLPSISSLSPKSPKEISHELPTKSMEYFLVLQTFLHSKASLLS